VTADVVPVATGKDPGAIRTFRATISAVLKKELRWRMRGRRAYVIATVYVLLLGLLIFGIYQVVYERAVSEARWRFDAIDGPGAGLPPDVISGAVSAQIGQALFVGMLIALTLLTLMIAPALAAGAVSTEREKQTLELLVTTPISTLGMLVAKLLASLAYVFLLIIASIPLMSLVFAFGGVAPEDVLRTYIVLLVIAFGIGSIGMFLSALIGRTQIATVVSYLIVLGLTVGTAAVHTWMLATSVSDEGRLAGINERPHAPEPLLWWNPLAADVDLICTALPDTGVCTYITVVTDQPENLVEPPRDVFWPRSVAAFLVLGVGLTLLSTQLITPSRRLRSRRHLPPTSMADEPVDPAPQALP
jgi:ABC-type transport system involved in multi-copper enzyme maturation permease subunit